MIMMIYRLSRGTVCARAVRFPCNLRKLFGFGLAVAVSGTGRIAAYY